ncbi:MAG: PQQ-dependent sugar dehydrogenase, partial [Actinobacteria bacterium]
MGEHQRIGHPPVHQFPLRRFRRVSVLLRDPPGDGGCRGGGRRNVQRYHDSRHRARCGHPRSHPARRAAGPGARGRPRSVPRVAGRGDRGVRAVPGSRRGAGGPVRHDQESEGSGQGVISSKESRPPYAGRMPLRPALFVSLLIATAACSGSPSVAPTPPIPTISPSSGNEPTSPSPSNVPDLSKVKVGLKKIATLDGALAMAVRGNDSALYVAEQGGKIMAIRGGHVDPNPVLDVSGRISSGGERGLLGLAFSPDGGFLYVNYTDHSGDTNVVEYRMNGNRADAGSARQVLLIRQPFANHNGGNVVFGPDGYLYIGMGDGGSQGDPMGNGQNLGVLLAKLLRIDPRPKGSKPYG